jgi:hypothetical protein
VVNALVLATDVQLLPIGAQHREVTHHEFPAERQQRHDDVRTQLGELRTEPTILHRVVVGKGISQLRQEPVDGQLTAALAVINSYVLDDALERLVVRLQQVERQPN